MPRITAVVATVAAVAAVMAGGPAAPGALAAAPPPIAGSWRWSDQDEALANARNPAVVTVRRTGRGVRARFGRGAWVPVAWSPGTRAFAFSAVRRVGRRGERAARVDYRGRLHRAGRTWRASGTMRIRLAGFRGRSSFTARRTTR
jgi:hypothetical protein